MATINDYKAWFDEVALESSEYEAASNLVHVLKNAVLLANVNFRITA